VLSLLRVLPQVIKNQLLGPVETHDRQRGPEALKNNRKPAPTAGLQFPVQLLVVR
jgi:hypothetical protein